MTFQNSTLTFQDMKDEIEFETSETLVDADVIRAINKGLSIYQRAERASFPNRFNKTLENQSVPSTGFNLLTNITDLGSDEEGLRVYRGNIRRENLLPQTERGSLQRGYFIEASGNLFLTPANTAAQDASFKYVAATTRFPLTQVMTTTVPIDKDVEWAFEEFILSRFYNRQNQRGLRDEAEEKFNDELIRYFSKPFRTITV